MTAAKHPTARIGSALHIWLLLLVLLLHTSYAFVLPSSFQLAAPIISKCSSMKCFGRHGTVVHQPTTLCASNTSDENAGSKVSTLDHSDIEWKLRPPEDTSLLNRLKLKLGANILRLDAKVKGGTLPPVLCPRGGQAVLEAYYREPGKRKKKIARFGITTSRGPSCEEIDTSIRELYNINPRPGTATIAAIIYMFVEPKYRKLGVGSLALEVISAIHSIQAVDFTVLVADDNGTGGLVKWYEKNGFSKAPLMQNVLGSPDGKFGVSMIRPVSVKQGFFDECRVKWW